MRKAVIVLAIVLLVPALCAADTSLRGRHQLALELGMWNKTSNDYTHVRLTEVHTSVGSNGAMGGISYGHWIQENLAVTLGVRGRLLELSTNVSPLKVVTDEASLSSLGLGMKYYFIPSTLTSNVRPYFKATAGPMIGRQYSTKVGFTVYTEERTEFAFGGQLATGLDIVTGRHFMLGVGFGYNLMSDFDQSIGGIKNFSGPEFALEFSWLI